MRLFRDVQAAWDARDRERLAELLSDDLLAEWERRLADFDRKGWHNRVEVLDQVHVEYVGLTNREETGDDRAVVFVEAMLRVRRGSKRAHHLSRRRVGRHDPRGAVLDAGTTEGR